MALLTNTSWHRTCRVIPLNRVICKVLNTCTQLLYREFIGIWGGDLKNYHWKVFEKGMKTCMMSHVKVCSSTTYDYLLAEYAELPMKLYAFELTMSFQQRLAHLLSFWLVIWATLLSQHLAKQGANTLHKSTTMWKVSWGLSHWDTHVNPTSKSTFDDIKDVFLADNGTLSISWGRN